MDDSGPSHLCLAKENWVFTDKCCCVECQQKTVDECHPRKREVCREMGGTCFLTKVIATGQLYSGCQGPCANSRYIKETDTSGESVKSLEY